MLSGVAAALAAAFLWTLATRLFQGAGSRVEPMELNAAKGAVALLLFGALLLVQGQGWGPPQGEPALVFLLLLSGAIGIGLGDTAYFRALGALGTRRVLLLELLAAPSAAMLAWLALGESLAVGALLGLGVTLAGVALAVGGLRDEPASRARGQAVVWGVVSAICQGLGVVLARAAYSLAPVDAAQAAWWRLWGGELLLLTLLLKGGRRPTLLLMGSGGLWWRVGGAALLGTWLGIWLQQRALSSLGAGVTQTLLATAPLFAMALAALAGRRPGWRGTLGSLLAVLGVALLAASS